MAIGAHAGDVEISMGAAILAHTRRGAAATVVHMTLGAKGHLSLSEKEYSQQKRAEAEAAARKMGADVRSLDYLDGELVANDEAKLRLADLIREVKPTHILTHWKNSIHKDHAATYQIVKDAIFYAALPSIPRKDPAHEVIGPYLAENWEDAIGYTPQIYLNVSDVFDDWLAMVRCYELFAGKVSDFDYIGYYSALATQRGAAAGYARAVTFSTDLPINVYLSAGFDDQLKLYTSTSPIFRPGDKQNSVG
jgi:LmbE family N-acetylglucosaminyl deacetylase